MLQVLQDQKTGIVGAHDVPVPLLKQGGVIVQNSFSLISAGTERSSVESSGESLVTRARKRPDLVKQVLASAKRDGIGNTYRRVRRQLGALKELGYSSAGTVVESSTNAFRPGDRVACAGAGYASHAQFVFIPKHLAAIIPNGVSGQQAAFTTVGAIALQGVRQTDAKIGETVVVIGLGLIGLITVQLLRASGCRVIGFDISSSNFSLAKSFGCDACFLSGDAAVRKSIALTEGYGADAVILTASTPSNGPLDTALQLARKKGRIVVVGAVGMNIPRSPFYEKELELRISCSYGPGRYDPVYEEGGLDYPYGYVRWTENRNMKSFLDLLDTRTINVERMITHTVPVQDPQRAYGLITGKSKERSLAVLLEYPRSTTKAERVVPTGIRTEPQPATPVLGFVGAGSFAQANLLPHIDPNTFRFKTVVNATPVSALATGKNFRFERSATEPAAVLSDREVNIAFIATRHDSHAQYTAMALRGGKHVFVEKPLAVTEEELQEVTRAYGAALKKKPVQLLVGFNRRFSRPMVRMKQFLQNAAGPSSILYRVNAGFIPKNHWVQHPSQGGRIVGEVCHFLDTFEFLIDSPLESVAAQSIRDANSQTTNEDTISVALTYANGSIATLVYGANGASQLPKEYCEVSRGLTTATMNNFTDVDLYAEGRSSHESFDGSKGHREEITAFTKRCLEGGEPLITFESINRTTAGTFAILKSLKEFRTVRVSEIGTAVSKG